MPRKKLDPVNEKLPLILRTPIKLPRYWESVEVDIHGLPDKKKLHEARFKAAWQTEKEREKKLPHLFDHYKIELSSDDAWENLARRLAEDYIPGFQVTFPKKRGAKLFWDDTKLAMLWHSVSNYVEARKVSARAACNILQRQEPWRYFLQNEREFDRKRNNSSKNPHLKTLYNKYQLATKTKMVGHSEEKIKEFPSYKEEADSFWEIVISAYIASIPKVTKK